MKIIHVQINWRKISPNLICQGKKLINICGLKPSIPTCILPKQKNTLSMPQNLAQTLYEKEISRKINQPSKRLNASVNLTKDTSWKLNNQNRIFIEKEKLIQQKEGQFGRLEIHT